MRALIAILCATLLLVALIPGTDTLATKPSKFKVKVDELKGPKTITLDDGSVLERNVHIFYKEDFAKPNGAGGGKAADTCYAVYAKGAKWKVTESYIVDPANQAGLADSFVRTVTADSLETWDVQVTPEIFGSENLAGVVDGLDTSNVDNKNEVMFGDIDDPNAIAVTITWGIFGGKIGARQLVEWDVMFDDADFEWGNADPTKMDFQNIATHEYGHAAGMSHPANTCTEETMYAFAADGETKKQDLNAGDIAGIRALYP